MTIIKNHPRSLLLTLYTEYIQLRISNYYKTFEKLNSIEKIILGVVIKFDSKANELINILGTEFNLDLSKEHPFSKLITRQNDLWKGSLPDNWIYQFHGSHCRFENKINNQILDIKINGGINYGLFNSSPL